MKSGCMEKRVYEFDRSDMGKLEKVLEAEPYAEKSFKKQGYTLKEGGAVGEDKGKYYVHIQGS